MKKTKKTRVRETRLVSQDTREANRKQTDDSHTQSRTHTPLVFSFRRRRQEVMVTGAKFFRLTPRLPRTPEDGLSTHSARYLHHCSSTHLWYFVACFLGNSPGWLADTVDTYCPIRPSQLTQKNITKHGERVDEHCREGPIAEFSL